MFNKRPLNLVRDPKFRDCIQTGYDAFLSIIDRRLGDSETKRLIVAIDGTHGVSFERLREALKNFYAHEEIGFIESQSYLKPETQIKEHFKENITDNRAFGRKTNEGIESYFQPEARKLVRAQLEIESAKHRLTVVLGTGAYWLSQDAADLRFFADISRELQQIKHKAGMNNFGGLTGLDTVEKYKVALFVEWPILETYRKRHLHEMDYYIDMNTEDEPKTAGVSDLLGMMKDISNYPLRVKPFFAPGVWGGQYLKQLADLPADMPNCAWSFEPIAPENSILIAQSGAVMEIPFLLVMMTGYKEILGQRIVDLFHDYFPIRFDYLDTIDGSNLSIQVHGKRDFLRKQFNEFMEQQESYYIMEKRPGSKVYLGFTESAGKESFLSAVRAAQDSGIPFDYTEHVQEWDCEKGDLFLIPTGTVHASGKDNLVLEISSTTWWFTFKIYDYVRKDSDGKPRPINIDWAEENIDFEKKTGWVRQNLIPQPQLVREQGENREYLLGKRDDLLFIVYRIHLTDEFVDDTNGEFMMLNLVEGEHVRIVSCEDESVFVELRYAESYILPSVFGRFKIINLGERPCKIIKAGVSPDWNERLVDERV
ncbi:mannose-6-phosphate isomerase [Paenibacillus sp. 32O-W]|nr:mannose-6-phosphate isomerase [Paenibacillus sp. 32O-W]